MKRFAEHVRLEHDLTERFIRVRTARPNLKFPGRKDKNLNRFK